MTKQSVRAEINSFVQGLVTEATPLNFPPNASRDEQNFEATRQGLRERRLGMDYEVSFSLVDLGLTIEQLSTREFNTFVWESVSGDFDLEFLVVQVGNKLEFFDLKVDSISLQGFLGAVTINGFPLATVYSFAAVDGSLVVAAGETSVAIVEYENEEFSVRNERLLVRDLWGVEVPDSQYEEDNIFRDNVQRPQHIYNLRNQSWAVPRRARLGASNSDNYDPIRAYRDRLSLFPSNSEVVWTGMDFIPAGDVPRESFIPELMRDSFGTDTYPSKGFFIIDLLNRGASRLQEVQNNQSNFSTLVYPISSLPEDRTDGGATVLSEFAGRVWYAGFGGRVVGGDARSPNLESYVLFSQLVTSPKDIFRCYQEGDPSSRDSGDILDTDGGFIRVSGASEIVAMIPLGRELVVLARNGVWRIGGSDNQPFTASSYEVNKITSFGCIGSKSVVVEGDSLYFWSEDGIYLVSRDQFGDLIVNSITQDTIKSFYEQIPSLERVRVSAVYDPYDRKVRWLFRDDDGNLIELILDTELGAFYKNRIYEPEDGTVRVVSLFKGTPFLRGQTTLQVVVNDEFVLVGPDPVIVDVEETRSGTRSIRYATIVDQGGQAFLTFSVYRNAQFRDFAINDGEGTDAYAFMLTGSVSADDSAIHKQVPFLLAHFYRTELGVDAEGVPLNQSSCWIRSQWDWANSPASFKYSPSFQAYRYRRPLFSMGPQDEYSNGFEVVTTRNKIRGRGRAFSFFLETEPNRDCRILGWVLDITGNQKT